MNRKDFIRNSELFGFVCVILLWYLLSFILHSSSVPTPHDTLLSLIHSFREDKLIIHIAYSMYRLIAALSMAIIIGAIIGVSLGLNKRMDDVISPSVYMLFPIPKAALLPAIFAVFGLGDVSKIFLIFMIVVFQVIIGVRDSVKNIPEELFISGKSMGMKGKDILYHIVFPSILPGLISSIRISVGIGLAVLFFSEGYATRYGVGYYIINKWSMIEYEKMYGGIVLLSLMGYAFFKLLDIVQSRLCRWSGQ